MRQMFPAAQHLPLPQPEDGMWVTCSRLRFEDGHVEAGVDEPRIFDMPENPLRAHWRMGLIRFERYRPLEKKTVDAKEVRAQIKALSKERDRLKAEVERLKSERAAFISDAEVIASIRGQLSVVS